jgi:hypothetical protein
MKKMPCIYLLLLLLGFAQELLAQRGAEELQKIVQFYRQAGQNLSFAVRYAYYENQQPKVVDTLSIRMTQNGADYRMLGPDFEWLKVGKALLWVDHNQEQMVVQNSKAEGATKGQKVIGPEQVAQLVQAEGLSIQTYQISRSQAGLRITDPENPGYKVELSYDPQSHCLLKMSLEETTTEEGEATETSTRINAVYSDYQLKKGDFPWSFKQFVQQTKKGISPTKTYQNYSIQTL